MKIEFASNKLESIANDIEKLNKLCRKKKATFSGELIIERLNELLAVNDMSQIPSKLRPHPLKGKLKGSFAINLDSKFRIIFHPNHDDDFRIDNYKTIKSIIIDELCINYHK